MDLRTVFLPLAISMLTACSSNWVSNLVRPYRIDVRQGNHVTQEMLAQLSPGMSREQVRFILGSPLLVDVFHADRWDYVYQFTTGYAEPQRRRVTVFFSGDKFARLEGNVLPSDSPLSEVPITPRVIDITGPAKPAAKP